MTWWKYIRSVWYLSIWISQCKRLDFNNFWDSSSVQSIYKIRENKLRTITERLTQKEYACLPAECFRLLFYLHILMSCQGASFFLNISHLRQQCHKSKFVIFQEKIFKIWKCYNFLWVQRRHNCSLAASFSNYITTLYLLKVHLQTFLSIQITQKMLNFELWHSCRKWALGPTGLSTLRGKVWRSRQLGTYTCVSGNTMSIS